MANQKLVDYIKTNLNEGVPLDRIKNDLLRANWSERDIIEAINVAISEKPIPVVKYTENQASYGTCKLWYLLPIFFTFMGGIVAYLLLQEKDKAFAKKLLITGVIIAIVYVIVGFVMVAIFASGASLPTAGANSVSTIAMFAMTKVTCPNGEINIIVKSFGTGSINISDLKFYVDGNEVSPIGCAGIITADSSVTCKIGSGLIGSHNLRIVGPSNTVDGIAVCG
ncbi:MAG: hypothetical protein KJ697_04710 [Nanoarchaeota archaeon]|nr:hypothetical protein [Nanoarchaeota archaeon]MBU4124374.1 hypothetical protein [Nanoarchaeota archaeon]